MKNVAISASITAILAALIPLYSSAGEIEFSQDSIGCTVFILDEDKYASACEELNVSVMTEQRFLILKLDRENISSPQRVLLERVSKDDYSQDTIFEYEDHLTGCKPDSICSKVLNQPLANELCSNDQLIRYNARHAVFMEGSSPIPTTAAGTVTFCVADNAVIATMPFAFMASSSDYFLVTPQTQE